MEIIAVQYCTISKRKAPVAGGLIVWRPFGYTFLDRNILFD